MATPKSEMHASPLAFTRIFCWDLVSGGLNKTRQEPNKTYRFQVPVDHPS